MLRNTLHVLQHLVALHVGKSLHWQMWRYFCIFSPGGLEYIRHVALAYDFIRRRASNCEGPGEYCYPSHMPQCLTARPQILCRRVLAMRRGLSSCRPLALISWDVMLEK